MQSAARINDLHACAEDGPNAGATLQIAQGSPNILINGLPAARMGDPVSCRLTSSPAVIAEGSSTVSFNGRPAARMGDKISSGGSISLGSGNVFIGDGGAIISIGDGVNVSFGDGCMVYLGCDPPSDSSKSTRNNALSSISSNVQATIAALDADMKTVSTAIKADAEELYVEEKSSFENFANEDLDDELHDALDPLGPVGAEISASTEGLGELGAAIVSGLKLLNSAKTAEVEEGPTAGETQENKCVTVSDTSQEAADSNKLKHIFGKSKHNLNGLVEKFGSQENAYNAIERSVTQTVKQQGLDGIFEITVNVGNDSVIVRGNIVDGIVKIGTAFIP